MAWLDDHEHVAPDPGGVDIQRPGVAVTDGSSDPEPDYWRLARAARFDLEQATDSDLIDMISRGSVPAFVALFDGTADTVRAELAHDLPGSTRINEVLAAAYLEVWWLAGCHRTVPADVIGWITGIARRRIAEASRGTAQRTGHTPLEDPRPSYAELEVATLLRRPVDRLLHT